MIEDIKNTIKKGYIERLIKKDQLKRKNLPNEFDGLPPEMWGGEINDSNHLSIRGIDLIKLSEEYGTPLHVVDKEGLRFNYEKFIGSFRKYLPRVTLATSYKTNPLPGVLNALHEFGTWAEVISHFELWLALRLGCFSSKHYY